MAWDPTDYKDMLDDDWNSIHERVKETWEEMSSEGYDLNSIVSDICGILGNMDAYEDIIDYANETEDAVEIIAYIMDKHYLTPIARSKRAKRMQENNSNTMKKGKYVNESLDDMLKEVDEHPDIYPYPPVPDDEDPKWLHDDSGPDDEDYDEETDKTEFMAELSEVLQHVFQEAAENGLTFEVVQDLVAQALDQVDWVEAGQM